MGKSSKRMCPEKVLYMKPCKKLVTFARVESQTWWPLRSSRMAVLLPVSQIGIDSAQTVNTPTPFQIRFTTA